MGRLEPLHSCRHAALLLVLALLAGSAGCRRGESADPQPPPADTEPVPGGTLVIGYPADVDLFHPLVYSSDLSGQLLERMFPLLMVPEFDCKCVYEPQLAKSWDWSDDGLTLTLHLRDDVTWSDGEPVDADDVLFTWELIADAEVGSPWAPYLENLRDKDPTERIDDHSVAVHYNHRYDRATMLSHVAGVGIVPQHVMSTWPRDNQRGAPYSSAPVTASWFRLESWDRGQQVVLTRDESHPLGSSAYLDQVVVRVIPEYATRLMALENGSIDMLPGIQLEDVDRLHREHPEIRFERRGLRYNDYIAWNLEDPRFADVRVRRALAHAMDVEVIIDALLTSGGERYGRRAVGTITPELCGMHNDGIQLLEHDLDRARELFGEAGWRDSDGDGWLDRDGQRLTFTLETNSGNPRRAQTQIIVQEQLRKAGVDVQLASVEGNLFFDKIKRHEFEAALGGWGSSLFVDPSNKWLTDGAYNYPSYSNPKVDELITRGLATVDGDEARRCWLEMQALIYEDQPYAFLFWRDEVVAIHERYRDVRIDALCALHDLQKWWVPADKQRTER